ncbi:MAG: S41 family peptidase [Anaerolineae bacterium]|jgi:carboxyl-terminal processing protease
MQITRKRVTNLLALLLLCATWFAIGWIVRGWRLGPEIGLVEQVRYHLLNEHPDEVPPTRELTYAAIRGMLHKIDDPHTALIVPPVSQRFEADFAGQSGVIGLYPEEQDGQMVVSVVFPGEPADQAGLQPGDIILSVDGVTFDQDTSAAETALLLRGPVGQPAHIVVRRDQELLQFDPIRQPRPIVKYEMLPDDIAYIFQHTFTTNASEQIKEALQDLLAQQPKALIWDLSSNGGGSMDTTQEILSYFVEDGLLFTAELKDGATREFLAEGEALAADIPLVVLISERTYSAAETAAATIKERGRGILIGSTTYGKGTIHATIPLPEDCLLQMTIAKWLSPNGEWYEKQGVPPDIVVEDEESTNEDKVLQFAVEYIHEHFAP